MLVVAAFLWCLLERTLVGRRIYATGGNVNVTGGLSKAAVLAGIRTSRVILGGKGRARSRRRPR